MEMTCSRDLISGLPDEILGKILSLLPTKVAASTSILSKRWRRNLLVDIDNLCFDESMVVYSNEEEAKNGSIRFCDFVDKTIALFSNFPIKKFSLCRVYRFKCREENKRVTSCVNRWICTAMEQYPLLELHLYAPASLSLISLETKMFTSNTLVKLTLSGEYEFEAERVFLPALKSLSLLSVYNDCDNYARFINGCPVREELYIRDDSLYYTVCCTDIESASLKRFVVFTNLPKDQVFHQLIYFDAPSLVYLDYTSYVFEQYQIFDLDMLVEARLNIRLWEREVTKVYGYNDEPIFGNVTDLLVGIRNITSLHLSPDSLETLHFCCDSMPVFNNLLNLSIESNKKKGWQVMPLMIKCCPNLQTLVIKGLVHKVTNKCGDVCACIPKSLKRKMKKRKIVKNKNKEVCCLRTCPVKVLEVLEYGASLQELKQMRHLLNNLECLETVKVGIHVDKNINCRLVRADVVALPRLSSDCNIQFI